MTKDLIIFDLDGTLIDTTEGILESVSYTIQQLHLPQLSNDILKTFIGPPIQESFSKNFDLSQQDAQNATNIFRDYYKNKSLLKAKLYVGIMDLIRNLKSTGKKIAVATYKREDYASTLLHHFKFNHYCDVIHGADDLNTLKKSDIIRLCIEDVECKDEQTILIGDSKHDALGAQEIGIDFLGVTYGFGFKNKQCVDEFPNVGCAHSAKQIFSIINSLN